MRMREEIERNFGVIWDHLTSKSTVSSFLGDKWSEKYNNHYQSEIAIKMWMLPVMNPHNPLVMRKSFDIISKVQSSIWDEFMACH